MSELIDLSTLTDDDKRQILLDRGYDPADHVILSNGSIKQNGVKGGIRAILPVVQSSQITPKKALDMLDRKKSLKVSAMRQALQNVTGKPDLRGGLTVLSEALAQEAIDGKGLSRVRAIELVYKLLDIPLDSTGQGQAMSLTLSEHGLTMLSDILNTIKTMQNNVNST